MPDGQPREPEVWRSPVFNPKTVRLAPPPRHDNAQLVVDIAACGWLQPGLRTLDATWGGGIWWKRWKPDHLVVMDAFPQKLANAGTAPVQGDFRLPPFPAESFPQIAYDPPYKLNGTPSEDVDERYGVDVAAKWQDRFRLALDGIAWWPPCPRCQGLGVTDHSPHEPEPDEVMGAVIARHFERALSDSPDPRGDAERTAYAALEALEAAGYVVTRACPACKGSGRGECQGLAPLLPRGGILVVKGMDQVVSQEVRWMATEMQRRAEAAGLLLVDRLDLPGYPRPQDEKRGQDHARQNVSFALVFQRPRGRKRPIIWTA